MVRNLKISLSIGLMLALIAAPALADTKPGEWKSLFNGESLGGWKVAEFAAHGEVKVDKKFKGKGPAIVVEYGDTLGGITWAPDEAEGGSKEKFELPKTNYEVELEFLKIEGNDFACGLTFPVGDSHASLILGGWGGATVGISSLDEKDASQNETTKYISFKKDRWYKVRLRVTPEKIESWLDGKKIVDAKITGRKITLRSGEINKSVPLGIATFRTSAAFREIKLRTLKD